MTTRVNDLKMAASTLNWAAYQRYKQHQAVALKDYLKVSERNDETGDEHIVVRRKDGGGIDHVFDNEKSRCKCLTRIREGEMCEHEIVCHDGFKRHLFEPMHFIRKRVEGSLSGWTPSTTSIDTLLQCEDAVGDLPIADMQEGTAETTEPSNNSLNDSVLNSGPGTLPYTASSVSHHLGHSYIKSVTSTVQSSYPRLNETQKKKISLLVMQLEHILVDGNRVDVEAEGEGGTSVVSKPTLRALKSEPRNRLMTNAEKGKRKKQKTTTEGMQCLGLTQILSQGDTEIQVNARKRRDTVRCGFCGDVGHIITQCQTKERLQSNGVEYKLCADNTSMEHVLRSYMENSIPLHEDRTVCPPNAITNLHQSKSSSHFVVHSASHIRGERKGHIRSLNYEVSFLEGHIVTEPMWIAGSEMDRLTCYRMKKAKYVYVNTQHMKNGWVAMAEYFDRKEKAIASD